MSSATPDNNAWLTTISSSGWVSFLTFIALAIGTVLLPRFLQQRNSLKKTGALTTAEKGAQKPFKWTPSDFKRPTPPPCPGWSIETTKPVPYRPFRYGPTFFITMGLRKESWDNWYELDNEYPKYHADKARRIKERGELCCKSSPEGYPAAVELLEELCSYLPARYPTLFRKTDKGIKNSTSRCALCRRTP
jgi:alpha-1,2-mannosyltransferase